MQGMEGRTPGLRQWGWGSWQNPSGGEGWWGGAQGERPEFTQTLLEGGGGGGRAALGATDLLSPPPPT